MVFNIARSRQMAGDLPAWHKVSLRAYIWWIKPFAVWSYWGVNSTLFRPSFSSTKVSPFTTNLDFFFPILSPSWKIFSLTISMIFWFFIHIYSSSLKVFHWLILISGFPPQSSITGLRDFSPVTWSNFKTHQLSYGARILSLAFWFSSPVPLISWEVFHWVLSIQGFSQIVNLHAQRSLRLRKKAIVRL